jgi:hypothetical protein
VEEMLSTHISPQDEADILEELDALERLQVGVVYRGYLMIKGSSESTASFAFSSDDCAIIGRSKGDVGAIGRTPTSSK